MARPLPNFTHSIYRVIPFERYFMVMLLVGLRLDEIKSIIMYNAFNVLPDEIYEMMVEEYKKDPLWKETIEGNRRAAAIGQPIKVPEEIIDQFKFKTFVYDLIEYLTASKKGSYKFAGSSKVRKILEKWSIRSYIESAAMQGMLMSRIVKKWNAFHPNLADRVTLRAVGVYLYFYWDVTLKTLDGRRLSIHNVMDYINLNKKNLFYDIHRYLIFRQPEELFHYFGLMTKDERLMVNKAILGDAVKVIRQAQRIGRAVPGYAVDLYKTINSEINLHDMQTQDGDVYRTEIERIIERVSYVRKERETLEDIMRREKELSNAEPPEKDEPYYGK